MSIQIIKPRETVPYISYEFFFQRVGDYSGNGYGFNCDENGNISFDNECQKKNYEMCLSSTEYMDGKVVKHSSSYVEPAVAICYCGEEIQLTDKFYGTCGCEKCGRWYNLFGQETIPPEQQMQCPDW